MDDIGELLAAIVPEKPKNKQVIIDAWLGKIEERLKEGVTLGQINEAIFNGEVSESYLKVMLTRARQKRADRETPHLKKEKEIEPPSAVPSAGEAGAPSSPPASNARAATSGDRPEAGHSPATGRGAPRPASPGSERAGVAGPGKAGAVAPAVAQDGEGGPTPEQAETCRGRGGVVLESQDDRLPPPWSSGRVTESQIPHDLPHRGVLVQARTWREVHYWLALVVAYVDTDPNISGLTHLTDTNFPDESRRYRKLKKEWSGLEIER